MEKCEKTDCLNVRRKHKRNLFRKGLVGFIAFHPFGKRLGTINPRCDDRNQSDYSNTRLMMTVIELTCYIALSRSLTSLSVYDSRNVQTKHIERSVNNKIGKIT